MIITTLKWPGLCGFEFQVLAKELINKEVSRGDLVGIHDSIYSEPLIYMFNELQLEV